MPPSVARQQAATVPGRNPRRRGRKENDEGGSLRSQPARKRSKLDEDNPERAISNGHALHDEEAELSNGQLSTSQLDFPVRGRHHASVEHRPRYSDENTLTKNDNFYIERLPGFPPEIANDKDDFRASLLPSSSLAVTFTRRKALVWSYEGTLSATHVRSFDLPNPSKPQEPVPIGKLVKIDPDGDTGLVVISPASGKVTFWENIENADALSLFEQRRNGTEGSVGSMFSGELIVNVQDAQHAGFILTFSSGRVAQLLLRDSQSRPAIAVNFLRKSQQGNRLFGGLLSAFGSSGFLKDVSGVLCTPSRSRGHSDVFISAQDGTIQHWQLGWQGQISLIQEINARAQLEAKAETLLEPHSRLSTARLIDISIITNTSGGNSLSLSGQVHNDRVAGLVAMDVNGSTSYALMELHMTTETVEIGHAISLTSYSAPLSADSRWTPRLYTVAPSLTAFVVFEKAVVIASLASFISETRGQDSDHKPVTFQDTVYLKDEAGLYVVGVDIEPFSHKPKQTSCVIHVREQGALRLVTYEPEKHSRTSPLERVEVTPKSKIEQAILYGTKSANPLNLARSSGHSFTIEDIENAALQVSTTILASGYDSASLARTVDTTKQLRHRENAVRDLAKHIKYAYPKLSRLTRWRLRWDGEKVAAAVRIWSDYNNATIEDESYRRLLPELVLYLGNEFKTKARPESGERDTLRQWFAKDIGKVEHLIPWAYVAVFHLAQEPDVRDSDNLLSLVYEAGTLVLGGLEAAYGYRNENAWLYNLDDENEEEGLLKTGYEGLPEFWTSTYPMVAKINEFISNAQDAAVNRLEAPDSDELAPSAMAHAVAADSVPLISVWSKCYEERSLWTEAQPDIRIQNEGREKRAQFEESRTELLKKLFTLEQTSGGMALAESYRDMQALAFLARNEVDTSLITTTIYMEQGDTLAAQKSNDDCERLSKKIDGYCEKFGYDFVEPYYSLYVELHRYFSLLSQSPKYKADVTKFLRASPAREKLGWINEVTAERDYAKAGQALLSSAITETNIWAAKLELSFAKLALLAADEAQPGRAHFSPQREVYEDAKTLVQIQEKLYNHTKGTTKIGVDPQATLQLLMETYGRRNSGDRTALQQLLERGFDKLVTAQSIDAEQLVEILTLMDSKPCDLPSQDIAGQEFALALQVLLHAGPDLTPARRDMLTKVIWRRCFLADDWQALNNTARKSDEAVRRELGRTILYRTILAGHRLGVFTATSRAPAPTDCTDAGTATGDYLPRFGSDDLAEPIAMDNVREAKLLQALIDHHQLGHWVRAAEEQVLEQVAREEEESRAERVEQVIGALADMDEEARAMYLDRMDAELGLQGPDSDDDADEEQEVEEVEEVDRPEDLGGDWNDPPIVVAAVRR